MIQPMVGDILVRPYRDGEAVLPGWTVSALGRPGEDPVPVVYTMLTQQPASVSTPPDEFVIDDDGPRAGVMRRATPADYRT